MNVFTFTQKNVMARIFAVMTLLALAASLLPANAMAQGAPEKVVVCKANQSSSGFSGKIEVNINAIKSGLANSGQNGDIVPPGTTGYPNGQNWDADYSGATGEQVYNNNCVIPPPTPTTGTLTVNKILNDSNLDENDFGFKVGDVTVIFNESGTGQLVLPLTAYSVVEVAKDGIDLDDYTIDYSAGCSGTMTAAGATCTITNTLIDRPTTLTLIKQVVGGEAKATDWLLTASGPMGFSGIGSTTRTFLYNDFNDIAVPTWTLTEEPANSESSATDGYTAGLWNCVGNSVELSGNNLTLVAGEDVTCTITNTFGSAPVQTCTVEIFSSTATFVEEKKANALALTYLHPNWSASIPGAAWIWGDNPVVNPGTDQTQTFTEKFGFVGTVTSAMLHIASDNRHAVRVNGLASGNSNDENNFQLATQKQYDVTSFISQNNNELEIAVTNLGPDNNPTSNPAGALYKLTIEGEVTSDADCSVPYREPEVNPDTYILFGYVWNDEDRDKNRNVDEETEEQAEPSLAGWTVQVTDGTQTFSTTTDEMGRYYFAVPAGTWTITQQLPSGWERTTDAESYVVTVPAPVESASLLQSIFNFFIPIAHAQAVIGPVLPTFGPFDFGNAVVDTTTTPTGGGGGGGGTLLRGTPAPQVGGVSDSIPTPMVLGEQVTAVPVGAPNTGAGGAAPFTLEINHLMVTALLGRSRRNG